ncbi:hypothetical protein PN498_02950 [Oscillatoria sp. CS-180]|uniref:hypothetical protein n=1 Tax=Oscillatoria sp. CS-180 TaxID=3021720 RepID=UPI00232D8BE8|nr:hypothetical protein [Oscillatoria sp. CS-180]MDB9524933.1 hypothetical protein [Oscillatoria sp. CS-180]
MEYPKQPFKLTQKAKAGRNNIQVGRDYTRSTTLNLSVWVSILVVVALGSYVAIGTDWTKKLSPAQSSGFIEGVDSFSQ